MSASKRYFLLGTSFLFLSVVFGAFGAHALKAKLGANELDVFKTGVTYQVTHGFALLVLGMLVKLYPSLRFQICAWLFTLGILLFSFNCYLYALTQNKVFAMVVPLGGLAFLLGWLTLGLKLINNKDIN